jgi:Bax protein
VPLVVVENERLHAERRWLEGIMRNGGFKDEPQRLRLQQLLGEYGLESDAGIDMALLKRLHLRIDVIPPGLVLAQAANESGWGTSRFSREVNNLFGEWTYRAEHGVMPLQRREEAGHYVRRFDSLRQSVRSYLNNLNRGRAYRGMRQLRASLRGEGQEPDALTLAAGLTRYSTRGEAYVAEIRAMILSNGLNDLGPLRLARSATAD